MPQKKAVVICNSCVILMTCAYLQIKREDIDERLKGGAVIACRLRNSRIKAKQVAIMEMYMSLLPFNGIFIANGPLSDTKGFICFMAAKSHIGMLANVLSGIGYCEEFYIIDFDEANEDRNDQPTVGKWKGKQFRMRELLRQDRGIYDAQSPHNRPFIISDEQGEKHNIIGYRGDGSRLGRRALPVEDCRCLVNLAIPGSMKHMADPFAGAGGIVCAARHINPNIQITTVDIDPILAPGLEMYGANHFIGDAAQVKLSREYDALVTEIPFDPQSTPSVLAGLRNFIGCLGSKGNVSIMCSVSQFDTVRQFIMETGMNIYCAHKINRKGADVAIIAATRDDVLFQKIAPLVERVSTIY